MESSKQKEYLSLAYLRALAAQGKIYFSIEPEDSDSIDVKLKKKIIYDGKSIDSDIGIQLKATNSSNLYRETDDEIIYDLKVKNYNDLRGFTTTKKYLALLILPESEEEWVEQDIEKLIIRRAMYWTSLAGKPDVSSTTTVAVHIPKTNVLDSETLNKLLENAFSGGII